MHGYAKILGSVALCAGAWAAAGTRAAAQDMGGDAHILGHELGANQGEVQLGQYVSQNSRNAAVRAYADLLARDHGRGADQVQSTASSIGVTPDAEAAGEPLRETQAFIDSLRAMSGSEMDRTFADHAVADHRKDISDTQEAIDRAQNPAVRTLLEGAMPVLRAHLSRAEALQRGLAGGADSSGGRRSMGVHKDSGR